MNDDYLILDRHIRNVLQTRFSSFIEQSNCYNFRCNVCGDSEKSKTKRRGYILKNKIPWVYYCHNCSYQTTVHKWMKEYFPLEFRNYMDDILRLNNSDTTRDNEKRVVDIKPPQKIDMQKHTRYFVSIKDKRSNDICQHAIAFCENRRIPESVWCKWYVATGGKYKNRIIIPFYNKKNQIYNFQARSIFDYIIPKYLTMEGVKNNIYNYYTVDKTKPVIILEGPIDSLFIKNSIAISGLRKMNKLDIFPYKYFLFDSDKDAKKKSLELLKNGEYVFIWSRFLKDFNLPERSKWDMNDVCIYLNQSSFTFSRLEKYFTNSIFDEIYFA